MLFRGVVGHWDMRKPQIPPTEDGTAPELLLAGRGDTRDHHIPPWAAPASSARDASALSRSYLLEKWLFLAETPRVLEALWLLQTLGCDSLMDGWLSPLRFHAWVMEEDDRSELLLGELHWASGVSHGHLNNSYEKRAMWVQSGAWCWCACGIMPMHPL